MVMQSGFSWSRREMFPAGLRVLVVDDDLAWLKILERMLKRFSYEVTTCALAQEALRLLRYRKDGFDIVISDVNMPDMDGFKLLEHVGLEMDLPVIMMSVDGETNRVMKGVQHGACDYLLKPIKMKELKNIWQHVVRKGRHDVMDTVCFDDRNYHNRFYGSDQTVIKKRKDVANKHDEKNSSDPAYTKKARVVWTVELHQKFVRAVDQIGIESDKIRPKKILDMMNVPWLTRENVASHLQKYRLYLSRIREEGEKEGSFVRQLSKNSGRSLSVHDSTIGQQHDDGVNPMNQGNQLSVSNPFYSEIIVSDKSSFQSSEASISYMAFDSPVANQYPWTVQADPLEPPSGITHGPSINQTDLPPAVSAIDGKLGGNDLEQLSPMERGLLSLSAPDPEPFPCVYPRNPVPNSHDVDPNFHFALDMKSQLSYLGSVADQSSCLIGWESTLGLPGEDLVSYCLQTDNRTSKDLSFDCGAPPYGPKFGFDYDSLFDFVEYPADMGLAIPSNEF